MRTPTLPLVGHGDVRVSALFRRPTPGPELDLLAHFLEQSLPRPNARERLAVFVEPRIETGCPDAVAVYWRPGGHEDGATLKRLTTADDRLLHFVWLRGAISRDDLRACTGDAVAKRANELVAMGFLTGADNKLSVADGGLALSRVIAVEAKMSAPSSALSQAARNTWFASESYVLLPSAPSAAELCHRYEACGVGILTPADRFASPTIPAKEWRLPQSYVTWQFNRLVRELSAAGVV